MDILYSEKGKYIREMFFKQVCKIFKNNTEKML